MTLSEQDAEQLAAELRRQVVLLEDQLAAEDYWTADRHVPVSAQLRVLLCDDDLPVLLNYAEHRGIPLVVWGPRPSGKLASAELLFSWSALVASWEPQPGAHRMSLRDYLDTPVHVVNTAQGGKPVTPTQVIKWVANKDGGAHFDLKKPASHRALRGSGLVTGGVTIESFQAKQIIHAIGLWTHSAIGACLGIIPPNG